VPTLTAVQTNDTADALVAKFVTKTKEANAARRDERTAEARALEAGMVAEAHTLVTTHGRLNAKHRDRVETASATDFRALLAAVPEDLQYDEAAQRMVSLNHNTIRAYEAAALAARAALRSTFGDSEQGREVDPVNLQRAARDVEDAIVAGRAHDEMLGTLSSHFRRAVMHLDWWVKKSRAIVTATEAAVARFETAEAALKAILATADVKPTVAPAPERMVLPAMPEQPPGEQRQAFYRNWDPLGGGR
jgi:hypothetical protein